MYREREIDRYWVLQTVAAYIIALKAARARRVICYTIMYYTILYHTILHYTTLRYTTLYYCMLCHIIV